MLSLFASSKAFTFVGSPKRFDKSGSVGLIVCAAVIAERSNIFIIKSIHRGDACVYDVALIELKLNVAGYGLLSVVDKSRKSFAKR